MVNYCSNRNMFIIHVDSNSTPKHFIYTLCLKNDTALACYNFDLHELILIIFGRNVTKKVRSQTVLYFPISPNYCFCTT